MKFDPQSRSISPENLTGERGKGGMAVDGTGYEAGKHLGRGMKWSPSFFIRSGQVLTLADIEGPGEIKTMWLTMPNNRMRDVILRVYYDGETHPSVEIPAADFFCDGWLTRPIINSSRITLPPANGYGSMWAMPFRRHCRITLENIGTDTPPVYWQINYELKEVSDDEQYLHASWRRANPLGDPAIFTIIDGIRGRGRYVGTYLGIQPNWDGWWGEGEIKFYMDGDQKWPTICGTGTEDYALGAWNFDKDGKYVEYSMADAGFHVTPNDVIYKGYQRSEIYRWHRKDPIWFRKNLQVTIQAIGAGDRYVPLVNADIFAASFWYMQHPHNSAQRSLALQARALGYASLADYLYVEPQQIPVKPTLLKRIVRRIYRLRFNKS